MKRRLFGVLLALVLALTLAPALPVTARADGDLAAPVITSSGLNSDGLPSLSWGAVSGAADYAVYRSTAENGAYSRMYTTSLAHYTNTSVTRGSTYWYKVCARDSFGREGPFSAPVSVTVPLARPTITSAAPNADGKPYLKWNPVSGAAKYIVYRAPYSYGTYKPYYTTTYTSFTNLSAKAGCTYYYKVCAVDKNGNPGMLSWSAKVKALAALTAPAITSFGLNANGRPTLTWEPVSGADKYAVYRSQARADGTYSRMFTTANTTYTNTYIDPGTVYYYKVCALDDAGNQGPMSAPVSVQTPLAAPGITYTGVDGSGKPVVEWEETEGAVRYTVYRADGESGPYSSLSSTEATTWTDASAQGGRTYWYKVSAIDGLGREGPKSAAVSVKATAALAAPRITARGVNVNGKPYLKWYTVSGAAQYAVYRSSEEYGTYTRYYTTGGTSFTNTSAQSGAVYWYKVCAVDGSGVEGPFSDTVKVNATTPLAAPVITSSGVNANGKPTLTWEPVDARNSVNYAIYRAEAEGGPFTRLYVSSVTTFNNNSAEAGRTYWYKVCAVGAEGGEGPFSETVRITAG